MQGAQRGRACGERPAGRKGYRGTCGRTAPASWFGVSDEEDECSPASQDAGAWAGTQSLVQGGWTDPGALRDILRSGARVFVTLWGRGWGPSHADVTPTR